MAYRDSRSSEFEEEEYYAPSPRRRGPPVREMDGRRSRGAAAREFEDVDVQFRERVSDRVRAPAFLREDRRRPEAGPMVLRQREVETFDRRVRSPSPPRPRTVSPPRVAEFEETRETIVERERSPSTVRLRRRSSSVDERERIRIIERKRVPSPSPSPSPPPPPPIIRGPTIEREVITHYRDIDHGLIQAREPSPSPPPPRQRGRERETDIDISLSKNRTDVDIHRSTSRARSRPRERRPVYREDDVYVRTGRDKLVVDDYYGARQRARSAAPLSPTADRDVGRERQSSTSIAVDWSRERGDRQIDIDVERSKERRAARPTREKDMWTEITKDLVAKEAIIQMGYEFQETDDCFYVMDYLKYEDVLRLTEITASIRRARRERLRQVQYEREFKEDWDRRRLDPPRPRQFHRRRSSGGEWEERVRERQVVYDSSRGPARDRGR